ncbi:MAG TPA: thaumatin family protein, partial [Polyangiaceae bacterium]|nr:thaumatin family protein [Polyangiaceae bacterium]
MRSVDGSSPRFRWSAAWLVAWALGAGWACGSNGGTDDGPGSADDAASGGSGSGTGGAEASGSGGTSPGGAPTGAGDSPFGAAPPEPTSIDCRTAGDGKTTVVFVNGCNRALEYRGSDMPGGTLQPGAFACVDVGSNVETISSKRYWGFIDEDPGGEHHTLAKFTFNTDFYDFDWYNISHVDAHNLPMQIVPVERPDCQVLTCEESWLATCPEAGKYEDSQGQVVSCV